MIANSMKLYVDDDSVHKILIQLLKKAGHDVMVPADVGTAGKADAVHLRLAIKDKRTLLSQNYRDFENLHDLILESGGHHLGILLIRRDNNPKKHFRPWEIVAAIANLTAANVPIADQIITLNHWK